MVKRKIKESFELVNKNINNKKINKIITENNGKFLKIFYLLLLLYLFLLFKLLLFKLLLLLLKLLLSLKLLLLLLKL